jgi:YHS domain-containing protein
MSKYRHLMFGLRPGWSFLALNILFCCCNVILTISILGRSSAPPSHPISPSIPEGSKSSFALALDGYCPVTLAKSQQWVRGDRRWGATHRGRTYLFTGSDEQQAFLADPDRYAPVISGNDIVRAMEEGQLVPGARAHGAFYDGHVFLFADEAGLEKFRSNPIHYASEALAAIQASNRTSQPMR